MSFTAPKFTNAGKELLSRALSGDCAVKFTSLALGSGELSSQAIAAMTALISEQKRVGLEVYKRIDAETVNVKGTFNNSELAAGFYWREVGLFAQNPDDPDNRASDILYCYQNAGDLAEYIPSVNDEVMEKTISLTTKISDAAEVTALLLSEVYTHKDDFEQFQQETASQLEQLQEQVEEDFVKKTGDEMSGPLLLSYLLNAAKNGYLFIGAGETVEDLATSSYLQFYGPNSNSPGKVLLVCRDADGQAGEVIAEWSTDGFKWNGSKVITAAGGTMTGPFDMGHNQIDKVRSIELVPPKTSTNGGFIDFHFAGAEDDYTARIIEDRINHLAVYAPEGFNVNGSLEALGAYLEGQIKSNANNALEVIRNDNETIAVRAENKGTGQAIRVGIGQTGTRGIYDEKTQHWIVGLNPDNVAIIDGAYAVKTVNGVGANAAGNVTISIPATPKAYITETWSNGESWYRRWSDGWIEQGGYIPAKGNVIVTCTLPLAFSNATYTLLSQPVATTESGTGSIAHLGASTAQTATSFSYDAGSKAGYQKRSWYACGY